jgi:hypothetical protein
MEAAQGLLSRQEEIWIDLEPEADEAKETVATSATSSPKTQLRLL